MCACACTYVVTVMEPVPAVERQPTTSILLVALTIAPLFTVSDVVQLAAAGKAPEKSNVTPDPLNVTPFVLAAELMVVVVVPAVPVRDRPPAPVTAPTLIVPPDEVSASETVPAVVTGPVATDVTADNNSVLEPTEEVDTQEMVELHNAHTNQSPKQPNEHEPQTPIPSANTAKAAHSSERRAASNEPSRDESSRTSSKTKCRFPKWCGTGPSPWSPQRQSLRPLRPY
jgi:hypothetical protein